MTLLSVLTASLLLLTGGSGADPQHSKGPAASPPTLNGSPRSGIAVHGEWIITVRNPNGAPASVHRFENALDPEGGLALARLLASPGALVNDWAVLLSVFGGTTGASACMDPTTRAAIPCRIAGPTYPFNAYGGTRGLVATIKGNTLELKGSIRSIDGGTIAEVWTEAYVCTATCGAYLFTIRNLAEPHAGEPAPVAIVVKPGQWIDVTVVFSFS